jgi:hypothetical protein
VAKEVKILMDGLRHINEQAFGADSSVMLGEAISNPAYLETGRSSGRQGLLIKRARIYPSRANPMVLETAASYQFVSQIQSGDQAGTPALMEINDPQLIAEASFEQCLLTGVGNQFCKWWPVDFENVTGLPLIVTPQFTIVHDADVNHAAYQSKTIYTVLDYAIVEVPNEAFTTLLLNQSRTS